MEDDNDDMIFEKDADLQNNKGSNNFDFSESEPNNVFTRLS